MQMSSDHVVNPSLLTDHTGRPVHRMVVCSFKLFRCHFYVYDIYNQDLSLVRLYLLNLSAKSRVFCHADVGTKFVRVMSRSHSLHALPLCMFTYWLQLSAHMSHSFFFFFSFQPRPCAAWITGTANKQTEQQKPKPPPHLPCRLWLGHFAVFCSPLLWFPHVPRWLSPGSIICSDSHCTAWEHTQKEL